MSVNIPSTNTEIIASGTLGIVDHDVVELSNLQRQILHTKDRMGMCKYGGAPG